MNTYYKRIYFPATIVFDGLLGVTIVASTVSIDCKHIVSRIKIVSARDAFHEVVKTALQKDSWLITHDPYPLQAGIFDLFVTPFIQGLVEQKNLLLLIDDIDGEVIEQWLPLMNTDNISKTC